MARYGHYVFVPNKEGCPSCRGNNLVKIAETKKYYPPGDDYAPLHWTEYFKCNNCNAISWKHLDEKIAPESLEYQLYDGFLNEEEIKMEASRSISRAEIKKFITRWNTLKKNGKLSFDREQALLKKLGRKHDVVSNMIRGAKAAGEKSIIEYCKKKGYLKYIIFEHDLTPSGYLG